MPQCYRFDYYHHINDDHYILNGFEMARWAWASIELELCSHTAHLKISAMNRNQIIDLPFINLVLLTPARRGRESWTQRKWMNDPLWLTTASVHELAEFEDKILALILLSVLF